MSLTLDHLVILVKELEAAVRDYTRLGFRVTPGGEHTDGATHNALVAFQDGSYLELIAFKRPAPEHRWWKYSQVGEGEGLIDFALLPVNIGQTIEEARQRGLDYSGPLPGGRLRPDGQALRWETGLPPVGGLPFLCADVTPRALRVPQGEAQQHPNGVTGISIVQAFTPDLTNSQAQYIALLGQTGVEEKGDIRFSLGQTYLSLSQNPGLADLEGPYALTLKAATGFEIDPALTHHVSLKLN